MLTLRPAGRSYKKNFFDFFFFGRAQLKLGASGGMCEFLCRVRHFTDICTRHAWDQFTIRNGGHGTQRFVAKPRYATFQKIVLKIAHFY